MHNPDEWVPPAPELRELQALVRRIEALEEMNLMEENRLASGVSCPIVRASLTDHILYLENQIKDTHRQIHNHIQSHSLLLQQSELLQSIPGIGEVTASVLLAEVGNFAQFRSARQVAAFARMVPRLRESGTSVRGKPRVVNLGCPKWAAPTCEKASTSQQ
ncbi:hypothetical protein IAD21_06037 [Abditibacteriota bacterium]|nr:hypothetical protein IAD21_06037 [Abditibacteriota bacterium]